MSNLSTAVAAENEILKAVDFTYGYDRAMHNIAVAMQSLISKNGNFIISNNSIHNINIFIRIENI